jgi:hypothetical protein
MTTVQAPASDMLVTVKSREVQRGMLAEMRGDIKSASRHFLAAAHLEIVLSNEYAEAGEREMSIRSRISAASCFWRGHQKEQAVSIFNELRNDFPDDAATFESELSDLKCRGLT